MSLTRGIVYVAFSIGSYNEAKLSADRAKKYMPDIPIWLYTDQEKPEGNFDHIVPIPSRIDHPVIGKMPLYPMQGITAKVMYMYSVPVEMILFLDTDITLIKPCYEIFDALEYGKYDISLVMNIQRYDIGNFDTDIPACIPVYNSGVIGIRKSGHMNRWYRHYWNLYETATVRGQAFADQLTLRRAIYERHDVRCLTMPEEYNAFYAYPVYLSGEAKILHGRGEYSIDNIDGAINRLGNSPRVWQGNEMVCSHHPGTQGFVLHRRT